MPIPNDSTRRQILELIKRRGEMTTAQLADLIGITSMGVRQHLNGLERDGLVTPDVIRQKRGRPTYMYRLTESAEALFPTRYGQVALELLEHLVSLDGPEKIDHLFTRRMDMLEREYRKQIAGRDLAGQIEELARIRDDEGYMAESECITGEEYSLVEHHCPIYAMARRYPQACQYEQDLFSRTLEASVQRIEHKITGDGRCRYVIKKSAHAAFERNTP